MGKVNEKKGEGKEWELRRGRKRKGKEKNGEVEGK